MKRPPQSDMKKYKILCADSIVKLEEEANKLIDQGYIPQGSMCSRSKITIIGSIGWSEPEYTQTMISPLNNNSPYH